MQMARVLTYAVKVNKMNIKMLKERVKNGPDVYPGANYVTLKEDSHLISLAFVSNRKMAEKLRIGDTVHRHL
jgi:DNA-directed RNA polymerase III subunit RPC1